MVVKCGQKKNVIMILYLKNRENKGKACTLKPQKKYLKPQKKLP